MDLLQELGENYESSDWNVNIERRFSCVVCLSPKFEMVYGLCQHRICTSCGYGSNGVLNVAFHRCPTCQQENVFPSLKPSIPEDNVTSQKFLGVRACGNEGCNQEIWLWEREEHMLICPYRNLSPINCSGHYSSVKDSFSTISPKSVSTRQRTRRAHKYSLRSNEKLEQKLFHTPKYAESIGDRVRWQRSHKRRSRKHDRV